MIKSFIFYQKYKKHFDKLSDQEAGQLIKSIFAYNEDNKFILSGKLEGYFEIIKDDIQDCNNKYQEKCKNNRDNVNKRWAKYREEKEGDTKDTTVYDGKDGIRPNYDYNNNNTSSSSSFSSSVKNLLKEKEKSSTKNNFNIFWKNYTPIKTVDGIVISKGSKQTAFKSYLKAIAKHTPEVISDGLERYLKHCQANNILTCGATVFLNQERFLNDEAVFIKAVNHSPPKKTTAEIYNSLMKKYKNKSLIKKTNENVN